MIKRLSVIAAETEFMVVEQKGKRKVIKKYFTTRSRAQKYVDRFPDKKLSIEEVKKY